MSILKRLIRSVQDSDSRLRPRTGTRAKCVSKQPLMLQQSRKSSVAAQRIVDRIAAQNRGNVVLVDSGVKPFEGIVPVAEADIQLGEHLRGNGGVVCQMQKLVQDVAGPIAGTRESKSIAELGPLPCQALR